MNIYLVEQDVNNCYDTYDSFVVVAENEGVAKHTSPSEFYIWKMKCGTSITPMELMNQLHTLIGAYLVT